MYKRLLTSLSSVMVSSYRELDQSDFIGTWKADLPLIGGKETIRIKRDNTIHFNNPIEGNKIYSYLIAANRIRLVDLDTGKQSFCDIKVVGCKSIEINGIIYVK